MIILADFWSVAVVTKICSKVALITLIFVRYIILKFWLIISAHITVVVVSSQGVKLSLYRTLFISKIKYLNITSIVVIQLIRLGHVTVAKLHDLKDIVTMLLFDKFNVHWF